MWPTFDVGERTRPADVAVVLRPKNNLEPISALHSLDRTLPTHMTE